MVPLHICLDPHDLNKAIIWEHYKAPTLDEITHKLSGAKVFSKLDVKDSFWSIHLDTPSSFLTTFNTHKGCYQFLCMFLCMPNFGFAKMFVCMARCLSDADGPNHHLHKAETRSWHQDLPYMPFLPSLASKTPDITNV